MFMTPVNIYTLSRAWCVGNDRSDFGEINDFDFILSRGETQLCFFGKSMILKSPDTD